jgi:hypothetical protein
MLQTQASKLGPVLCCYRQGRPSSMGIRSFQGKLYIAHPYVLGRHEGALEIAKMAAFYRPGYRTVCQLDAIATCWLFLRPPPLGDFPTLFVHKTPCVCMCVPLAAWPPATPGIGSNIIKLTSTAINVSSLCFPKRGGPIILQGHKQA